jgi:hypothetical protein
VKTQLRLLQRCISLTSPPPFIELFGLAALEGHG